MNVDRKIEIRDEGHGEMPLELALDVAAAVAHRQGGTDQALRRLAKESKRLARIEADIEAIMADQADLAPEMPDDLWNRLNGDRAATERAFTLAINVSRRNLRERIEASFAEGRG